MTIIVPANTLAAGGFDVDNSCRFNDGDSAYMHLTPGSGGNRRTFTISMWVKRSEIASNNYLWGVNDGTNPYVQIVFNGNHKLYINDYDGSEDTQLITTQVFRDVSAWYHIVIAYDTTQSTAANRIKLYVNGTRVTAFDTETYPAEDFDTTWNNGVKQKLGAFDTNYFDGYMAEVVMIEGSQLAPTSFGEFDSDSGIWKPIDVSGLTFGDTGYYLNFQDSSALGNDVSGENHDWTSYNLAAIDQTTDTCTNNFATMNFLDNKYQNQTFTEGNLKVLSDNPSPVFSTIGMTTGKFYMEAKAISGNNDYQIGICSTQVTSTSDEIGLRANDWGYKASDGKYKNNGSDTSYGSTYSAGDIIGVYLDLDNNKLYFAKNGALQASGTGISITASGSTPLGAYFFTIGANANATKYTWEVNFGNPLFTGTDKSDPNGYGSFEYDPSVGTFDGASKSFYALNTKNLAEYG